MQFYTAKLRPKQAFLAIAVPLMMGGLRSSLDAQTPAEPTDNELYAAYCAGALTEKFDELASMIGPKPTVEPDSAARIVKAYARRVGLDPAAYSGNSLRAGFITSAAEAGASIWKLSEVSRHKSMDVLRGYVRRADSFKDHAGAAFL